MEGDGGGVEVKGELDALVVVVPGEAAEVAVGGGEVPVEVGGVDGDPLEAAEGLLEAVEVGLGGLEEVEADVWVVLGVAELGLIEGGDDFEAREAGLADDPDGVVDVLAMGGGEEVCGDADSLLDGKHGSRSGGS